LKVVLGEFHEKSIVAPEYACCIVVDLLAGQEQSRR
jgi:hypothetical protein